ncbi:TolC family protein [Flavisolibacter ginsenosidimutans]|uniref:TolC family protein n=1 Tax=Flavisolibacter ginsenosidimutans TaxID=661481 RepID=A0A5B8UKA1_9BACT|nr:TolC family protein [Flavisolibacter ginsenosidimutans]QEC57121.1 TolC family protein [Flavisolibacter ginsenosidimutans]
MKRSRIASLAVFLFFTTISFSTFAQEKKNLTLTEAIDLSIKNSKQLKSSAAKIEEATFALKEAVERRLPEASASGAYLRLNNPNISLKTKSSSSSGGGTTAETPKPSQAVYGILNASMPIFSGFRIKYGIESAKYLEQAAKLDADNDKEAIVLNTIDAYNNLYKSKAVVDLVNENLQSARGRATQFANLEKNGILPRNDLLKAQLQVSNTELSLLDAQNNWKLANINMDLMLGLPETTELAIDSASLQTSVNLKGVEEYVQAGLQNRKDLSALGYRKKAAATAIKISEGEKYPSLAVTGGYMAADIPGVLSVTNVINIGLGVQYSLSSLWKNNSKVKQAEAREKQVAANEELLADAIRLQVNQAYQNYLSSNKKIDVHKTAIAQASENYRIVNNKYQNSLATTTELLDADVALLQARLNYAFAQSDAVVAYNRLLQSAGLLTGSTNK